MPLLVTTRLSLSHLASTCGSSRSGFAEARVTNRAAVASQSSDEVGLGSVAPSASDDADDSEDSLPDVDSGSVPEDSEFEEAESESAGSLDEQPAISKSAENPTVASRPAGGRAMTKLGMAAS